MKAGRPAALPEAPLFLLNSNQQIRLADDFTSGQAEVWCRDTLVLYHYETKWDAVAAVESFNTNNINILYNELFLAPILLIINQIGDENPVSKKSIYTVLIALLLAGSAWAGERAKTSEEIALPAIKISKTKDKTDTRRFAAADKDKAAAVKNKKSSKADGVEPQPM